MTTCPCSLCAPTRRPPAVLVYPGEFSALSALAAASQLRDCNRGFRFLLPAHCDTPAAVSDLAFFVDPWGRRPAANYPVLRRVVRWLQEGGTLVLFSADADRAVVARLARIGRAARPASPQRLVPRFRAYAAAS